MKFFLVFLLSVSFAAWANAMAGGHEEVTSTKERARLLKIVDDNLCKFEGCWELVKVEKITTQVVSGSLARVSGVFEEVMEEKFYKAEVEIWEQPWLNKVEVTFNKGKQVK